MIDGKEYGNESHSSVACQHSFPIFLSISRYSNYIHNTSHSVYSLAKKMFSYFFFCFWWLFCNFFYYCCYYYNGRNYYYCYYNYCCSSWCWLMLMIFTTNLCLLVIFLPFINIKSIDGIFDMMTGHCFRWK